MSRLLARALASAVLLAAGPALAHKVKRGAIEVVHPWTMESDGGEPRDAPVYMTIRNASKSQDRLLAVRCAAAKAEIAASGGAAETSLEVKPQSDLVLDTKGPRVVLRGITKALSPYDMLPLTLVFEKAGEVGIEVMVEAKE